jgi:Cof subfamily protein (haloacid dehalogenase superfamily)
MRPRQQAQRIRFLVLDVDGTLLTDDYRISMATRMAVQQVVQRGVQVILASARSPSGLHGIMGVLGLSDIVIAYTGAITCRLSPDLNDPLMVLTEQRMNLDSARYVLRDALAQGVSVGWFCEDRWFIPDWDLTLRRESALSGVIPIVTPNLDLVEAPHKLQCIVGDSKLLPRLSLLARSPPADCLGQFSYANYLEITHQGVNKATALLAIGQRLGVDPTAMVAIGDGENDRTMLQVVGLGIAMGNASPYVQAVATWVTDTNNRDGLAKAINRLIALELL